ncbi:hypothetical protein [Streptomyces sp. C10-9-1]|uniref:hypothetical protein n=1 Tax=Streptomyces sp. C10-9-1 TaxID=1859285 RepID=UPI003F49E8F7
MPERMPPARLREIQNRIIATRRGPWEPNGDGFGPFSFVEPWDDAELGPAIDFCTHARTDVPALLGEIAAQDRLLVTERGLRDRAERLARRRQDRIAELEQQLDAAQSSPLAWAATLDADDLEGFLTDIAQAAGGDDDLSTLRTVEKKIAEWRAHAHAVQEGRGAR